MSNALKTILLTGFEPFGTVQVNPSQAIVQHFAGDKSNDLMKLVTHVLPVDYKTAGTILTGLIKQHEPDAVIMLGVAARRDAIALERVAINVNDAALPDNAGHHANGQRIVEDGPVGYWSTLPLDVLHGQLSKAQIRVKYSNHAGAYLCNHVFYVARHLLEMTNRPHVPCGFIHLPAIGDDAPKMPLATLIDAVQICVDALMIAEWDERVTG